MIILDTDHIVTLKANVFRGEKFERPQILMQDGHPTHLYVASVANVNGSKGTHCCVFGIKKPTSTKPTPADSGLKNQQ